MSKKAIINGILLSGALWGLLFWGLPKMFHEYQQSEQLKYNDHLMQGGFGTANKWCWEEQKMDHPRVPASVCL